MNRTLKGAYGSTTDGGKSVQLTLDTDQEQLTLKLPAKDLTNLITMLAKISLQSGEEQGIPAQPPMEISTMAIALHPTAVSHAVVDAKTSALIAHHGAVNFALHLPHASLIDAALSVQALLKEG